MTGGRGEDGGRGERAEQELGSHTASHGQYSSQNSIAAQDPRASPSPRHPPGTSMPGLPSPHPGVMGDHTGAPTAKQGSGRCTSHAIRDIRVMRLY